MGIGKIIKAAGKVGLGGVPGLIANDGMFPAMSGLGIAQRLLRRQEDEDAERPGMKRGGKVKKYAKGGSTASKRADGCATKGKTKGRFV